jgi:hypothetical protein
VVERFRIVDCTYTNFRSAQIPIVSQMDPATGTTAMLRDAGVNQSRWEHPPGSSRPRAPFSEGMESPSARAGPHSVVVGY